MNANPNAWVLLTDDTRARLLRAHRNGRGPIHLDEVAALEDPWVGHEHHRPTAKRDLRQGGLLSPGHETEQREHSFAVMIGEWAAHQMRDHGIDRLVVFTPPRFLGAIRKSWPKGLLGRVDCRGCELINTPLPELREHPAVVEQLDGKHAHRD